MQDNTYDRPAPMLSAGECILWRGKPKRSAFIATKSLTLLPIAIVWLCVDSSLIVSAFQGDSPWFLIPFMLLHLMPVWVWLGSTISAGKRWQNTNYYVTNKRIILQGGFFAVNEQSLYYKDIQNVQMRIGLLDKLFHTGDIVFDNGTIYTGNRQRTNIPAFEDLEDPQGVYRKVQQVVLDIQTDIEYPNAYRPAENPGYNTNYRP